MSHELTLITISGKDQPGITSKIMQPLVEHNCRLQDIGQSITHGLLSLSFLIESSDSSPVVKELLFIAKEMDMQLDFQKVSDQPHLQSKRTENYIITCVSPHEISPAFVAELSSVLAKKEVNIKRIDNLHPENFGTIEFQIELAPQSVKVAKLKASLLALSHKHSLDLAMIQDNVWRRNKRLIVFDMDSTLIKSEVIVEMAKAHGVGDQVHEITERAMNGEIDFDQSLTQRVALLKGLPKAKLDEIMQNIQLSDGVENFIRTVKKLGYKTAVISGGFQYFAKQIQQQLELDYVFANDLKFEDEILTGEIQGEIINAKQKAILLEMLAQQEGINLEQVVAIGDGANDLPMLAKAGLGIAFHAKEIVKQNAKQHMSFGNMSTILHFLGIPRNGHF